MVMSRQTIVAQKRFNVNKKSAMTLAEVLITLGIIGVVASLTISMLLSDVQKQKYYSSFYKEYTVLSQVVSALVGENGDMTGAIASYGSVSNAIAAKTRVSKVCPMNTMPGECMPANGTVLMIDGTSFASGYDWYDRLSFLDGQSLAISTYMYNADCNGVYNSVTNFCGAINIDTNGPTAPNQFGRDIFIFYLTKNKLVPAGGPGQIQYWSPSNQWYCNPTIHDPNSGGCCASRLLQEGAMKY